VKVLLATANSRDLYIDVEREHRALQQILSHASTELQVLPAVEVGDLSDVLTANGETGHIDILHFCGHATPDKGLHFRGPGRKFDFVAAKQLSSLLKDARIQLVVLNACNTQALAESITDVVPAAIGTTRLVRDVAARQFTRSFYQALAKKYTFREAFEKAVKEQKTTATPGYIYAGVDQSHILD